MISAGEQSEPRREVLLSEFVDKTGVDAGLARDLLEGTDWDLPKALKAFSSVCCGGAAERKANISPDFTPIDEDEKSQRNSVLSAENSTEDLSDCECFEQPINIQIS